MFCGFLFIGSQQEVDKVVLERKRRGNLSSLTPTAQIITTLPEEVHPTRAQGLGFSFLDVWQASACRHELRPQRCAELPPALRVCVGPRAPPFSFPAFFLLPGAQAGHEFFLSKDSINPLPSKDASCATLEKESSLGPEGALPSSLPRPRSWRLGGGPVWE